MQNLHVVHPNAKIGKNVTISPFCVIEEDVEIGDNTWIGPGVSIMNGVRLGSNCKVFQGAILGSIPQDLKFGGEKTTLEIADHVTIREYCTINKGTEANQRTYIGAHTLIMAYVHVAHDCIIQERCIIANNVNLAGHVEVDAHVIIGGMCAVHQFVKIGQHVMVGGGSLVRKDIPPYVKAAREPIAYAGVNSIGLKRRGFTQEQVNRIQDMYRILFVKGNNTKQAVRLIQDEIPDCEEKTSILNFIDEATRGLIKGLRQG